MTHSSETQLNQVHTAAIETLAEDAIHAVGDGTLGEMVEETNELLEKAEAPVQVVQTPPKTLDELIKRAQARTPEEKERRRLDLIHTIAGRGRLRRGITLQSIGKTVAARNR